MCGIAGILSRSSHTDLLPAIQAMSAALAHRGPDGEGFLLSDGKTAVPCAREYEPGTGDILNYLPAADLTGTGMDATVALAHRRLSILDLSRAGHEPMCDSGGKIWITFNGEIYNYIELRAELALQGYDFRSHTDTEVIIYAYRHWGEDCVSRFNGMWAFCILDLEKGVCFASRDRLGVKPFYYVEAPGFFAFASEQKAFVRAGLISASFSEAALHNYLVNGLLETAPQNFFAGVTELWPGTTLTYDLRDHRYTSRKYFDLKEIQGLYNDHLSDAQLIGEVRTRFENAVRLRLRSDVEVGTCLSGGIDSSAIAVTIARFNSSQPFHCFTAAFPGTSIDEGEYAAMVADQAGAIHHLTEPSLPDLLRDFDELIYSQDTPIWDTSTYAQHRVMALAAKNRIKVVLDGQGADELFTGYHHHFTARRNGLLQSGEYRRLWKELREARVSLPSPALFYFKEKLKYLRGGKPAHTAYLRREFVKAHEVSNPFAYESEVNAQLIDDIQRTRLKTFLKCEDRCGMWHGVESRTPFSDDKELISLMFSFSDSRKISGGKLKYLLREAVKQDLPPAIYNRFDKRGFETPMQRWVEQMKPRMRDEIRSAGFSFLKKNALDQRGNQSAAGNRLLFKLFVLARWQKVFDKTATL